MHKDWMTLMMPWSSDECNPVPLATGAVRWYSPLWNSNWFVICCDYFVLHQVAESNIILILTKGTLIPANDLLKTLLLGFCQVAYIPPAQDSINFAVTLHFII